MEERAFRDLAIGAEFRFDRNGESGLLTDLDTPGNRRYVKTSSRKWRREDGMTGQVGSVTARVWLDR